MVNSQVPKIILNDDNDVELTVQVVGLMQKKTVEIYGYITQNDGANTAYASFRDSQVVLKPDGSGVARVTLVVPHDKLTLTLGVPVTVVTWVSEIWPSMLTADKNPSGGFERSWTAQDNWPEPSAGDEASGGPSSG